MIVALLFLSEAEAIEHVFCLGPQQTEASFSKGVWGSVFAEGLTFVLRRMTQRHIIYCSGYTEEMKQRRLRWWWFETCE